PPGPGDRLLVDLRRDAADARALGEPLREPAPIRKTAFRAHREMRRHAEKTVSELGLEPVHDRQDHDQRGDAKRDADERRAAHERHDPAAAPRAHVTQADEELERLKHRRIKARDGTVTYCSERAAGPGRPPGRVL